MGSNWYGIYTMNKGKYNIKVVSGSKEAVDDIVQGMLEEYPISEYGTVVLPLDENEHIKTVRVVRYETKDLCDGKELRFVKGIYPFDSGINL